MSEKSSPAAPTHTKLIAQNRRARFDFAIEEKIEAGLQLVGSEVKSLREGNVVISDAYGIPRNNELFLVNCKISLYSHAGAYGHAEPDRPRKLLLHRRQLDHLIEAVQKGGYTLIPLSLYFKDSKAKVELGLAKGKRHEDRREDLKAKDAARDMDRAMATRGRGSRGGKRDK
jgi:SsrA-binding protein